VTAAGQHSIAVSPELADTLLDSVVLNETEMDSTAEQTLSLTEPQAITASDESSEPQLVPVRSDRSSANQITAEEQTERVAPDDTIPVINTPTLEFQVTPPTPVGDNSIFLTEYTGDAEKPSLLTPQSGEKQFGSLFSAK